MRAWHFARDGLEDFEAITDYLIEHADHSAAASVLVQSILDACQRLAESPLLGTPRPELRPGLRSFPVHPYLIFYHLVYDDVEILRILHQRRNVYEAFGKRRDPR